ncbi:MAG: guanylate kinase [SAR116 cluster bacterium]|nr:guanylate kinase [SAR116 cluster bacterium]RPG91896.1 MAG: guanylate kinase [Candidatus Puniceispirillum sp. TMED213]|tara:strand:- start:1539 stop:2168 length:630 start_codon:yes stop_codon:yes gene_type:complete
MITRRGLMLVLSSPSGAGKTSIARSLLTRDKEINMSVSATTRPRRPGEAEGKDYYFVDEEKFKIDINKGLFLEYARVFDHYYGTPLGLVQKLLSSGCDVLFDIDWQGTQQIKAKARDDLVSIFVLPPSTAELEKRLITRAQDSAEVVAGRMARAADEMSHYPEYDYIIVNHDLDQSIDAVHTILKAERLRRSRQASLTEFMKQLREGCS